MSLRDLAAKATPGPWEVDPYKRLSMGLRCVTTGRPKGLAIASLMDEEDAALIALAPELAVLCADVFEWYGGRMPSDLLARFRELEARP